MKEYDILEIIKHKIGNEYIGDDCAYLNEQNIVVSQDSFIEDIHFNREWYTPFQLGYKSTIVNISDILASGATPKYITIALSLPNNIDEAFINDYYDGVNSALSGAKVIGGDITGSTDKIFISITAIGDTKNRHISSRANAKEEYFIVTKGLHGTSSAGLNELLNNGSDTKLKNAHICPQLEYDFANSIATLVESPYAMMDTSDGLADALYKIAEASNKKIIIDYNKIEHLDTVSKEQVLFGGEDYKLVAAIPEKYADMIDCTVIGRVAKYDGVRLDISGDKYSDYTQLKVFNHFK